MAVKLLQLMGCETFDRAWVTTPFITASICDLMLSLLLFFTAACLAFPRVRPAAMHDAIQW